MELRKNYRSQKGNMPFSADPTVQNQADAGRTRYELERISHWDAVARQIDTWSGWGGYYHRRIAQIYQFLVPLGQRVLEVGCGRGDLLAALRPSEGIGVDFSRNLMPGCTFEFWRDVEKLLRPWIDKLAMFAQNVLLRTD